MISVTQALSPFSDFSGINPEVLQHAAERGSRVHRACAAYASGFPALGLHDEDHGYFHSFVGWFDSYVDKVLMVEKRLTSPLGYTGQIDLACQLTDGRFCLVDYKTPALESPTWKAQIAAYCELALTELDSFKKDANTFYGVDTPATLKIEGMALMLNKNGKAAKGIVYQYQADDFAAFLSCLNAYRYFKK